MKSQSTYNPIVPSVDQACRVLLCLEDGEKFEKKLGEICAQVGISQSKAYTVLNTLQRYGLVRKDVFLKTYSLGPGLIHMSRYFLDNIKYMNVVAPLIQNLARETSSSAFFGVVSGDNYYVIDKHEGNQKIGFTLHIGHRSDLTFGPHGKSIVAFMPPEKRKAILKKKRLYFHGEPAALDMERLQAELAECRRKGYATDIGEIAPGVNCVSAPVFGANEDIIGCVVLLGTFSGAKIDQYGEKTAFVGREISYRLGANLKHI